MAPSRAGNRAKQFQDLEEKVPVEFDPEEDRVPSDSDQQSDSDESDGEGAREHYVDVGKSKLRKKDGLTLGPQYIGSRVSRDDAMDDEDEDDPFDQFSGEESEEEQKSASDDVDGEDEVDGSEAGTVEEEDDDTPGTDLSDAESEEPVANSGVDRSELRKIMAKEQQAVAATLSQAVKDDAEKGRAVKKQRTGFDSLLNTRIKLQKALIATNTLPKLVQEADKDSGAANAVEAAETAAYQLWYSLNTFREDLIAERTGTKRKRTKFTSATPTNELWTHMQAQEAEAVPHRNSTLDKWSIKARGASAMPAKNRINNTAHQATIVDVLRENLSQPDRLIKRTRTPRSCAPLQLADKVAEDENIYDDADFYGLLLQALLEQKNSDSVATANVNLDFNSFQARREAKTKRPGVDTKASKGRKLRYTVHEKLQNFMAPEDRASWGERQVDELFGSLFGQRLGLGEDKEDEEMADEADDDEGGLMLFRS